jgi:glutaminyl-tRNA synthetase
MRRRGYTPASIRKFCERVGVAKRNNVIDMQVLEHAVREDLNLNSPRVMAVLNPLKVVLDNYPEGQFEDLDALDNPDDPNSGTRKVRIGREIYIERDDFLEHPTKKFYRLSPGKEVRLRYGYLITCNDVIKDPHTGEIIELRCSYDPASRGGKAPDGRKVRGTIHWVDATDSIEAEVRLYEHLFKDPNPPDGVELGTVINSDSLKKLLGCKIETSLCKAEKGDRFQFERLGYFVVDECYDNGLVFNRTVTLRDTWGKITKTGS